jgi:very-short-patch-repair endonuclease
MEPHNKILIPPKREQLNIWIIEKYGDDFEPKFLEKIIEDYLKSTLKHKEYSKKKSLLYIGKYIIRLDRIYRKQETSYWIKRGWGIKIAEGKRVIRDKKWYIEKYGLEEGVTKYNNKNINISNTCGHTLEKYIKRYGENLGIIKYNDYRKNCARNLAFFIKKYGDVEGNKKYKTFKKHIGKASKESLLIFEPLIDLIRNKFDLSDIYYGSKTSREFFIINDGKTYLYDFTIKSLKLIIEFNGVKFHVNESWSKDKKKLWKHPFKEITYDEMVQNDKFKLKLAESNGFEVLTIWSDTPIEENIKMCEEFINKKLTQ